MFFVQNLTGFSLYGQYKEKERKEKKRLLEIL